ncbi:MAG TPA: metallopeptidase family protein [Candidatus Paceibacterota bacterium]|jgi:predicted Zn-dependent protease with MMP-like domain|nr:metallopeptidase family protein [Candidatus Paceibacterota bacterium]
MLKEDFEKLVAEGYERLPEWVRQKISNVAILIEDEPSDEDREAQGLGEEETLLGLYKGIPLSVRGEMYGVGMTLPDTITIYMLPTLDMADEECGPQASDEEFKAAVRKIVADTIWHEFAHHFGMDEQQVRGREKDRGID